MELYNYTDSFYEEYSNQQPVKYPIRYPSSFDIAKDSANYLMDKKYDHRYNPEYLTALLTYDTGLFTDKKIPFTERALTMRKEYEDLISKTFPNGKMPHLMQTLSLSTEEYKNIPEKTSEGLFLKLMSEHPKLSHWLRVPIATVRQTYLDFKNVYLPLTTSVSNKDPYAADIKRVVKDIKKTIADIKKEKDRIFDENHVLN